MIRLICIAFLSACATHTAPVLTPFEVDGQFGYNEPSGKVVVPATLDMASPFVGEIAWVADDDGLRWIDRRGKPVANAFVYDNGPDYFAEDFTRVVKDGQVGFLHKSGKLSIAPRYAFASPFDGGVAAFCEGCKTVADGEHSRIEGGTWGLIDTQGTVVEPANHATEAQARATR